VSVLKGKTGNPDCPTSHQNPGGEEENAPFDVSRGIFLIEQ